MARKYLEQTADALVGVYKRMDRPTSGFFALLADKGYLPVDHSVSRMETVIRGLFSGLASAIEAVGRLHQPNYDFFDLLEAKGYLPAARPALAAVVPVVAANDNLDDDLRAA